MNATTRANLEQALRGEALAALKYWLFEERAQAEGREEVADLFGGIGKQERREHAREIATMLGMPGSTRENLLSSIEGEVDEHRRLYPGFASMARQSGDIEAAELFQELGADEHGHANALRNQLERLEVTGPTAMVGAAGGTTDM